MRYWLAAALALIACGAAFGVLLHHDAERGTPHIVFTSGGGIVEIDLSGGHRHTLSRSSAGEGLAALPDGSRVVSSVGRIVHLDARGGRLDDLGPGVLAAVSPDGAQLVASIWSATREEAQLWLVNVDGSGRRQLTSGALDSLPTWSPDGSTILFSRFATHAFTPAASKSWLETVPAGGGVPHRLTSSGFDSGGHYSPDGRTIAFGSARDRAGKVCGEDECRYRPQLYYGDRDARALAERRLRSLSASGGHVEPDQPLPAPPRGILDGLACQPPAISPSLPAHP